MISVIHVLNKFSVTASALDQIFYSLETKNIKPAIFSGSSKHTKFNHSYKIFNKKVLSHNINYPFFSILFSKSKLNKIKSLKPNIFHLHHARSSFIFSLIGKLIGVPTLIEDAAERSNYSLINRILFTSAEVIADRVVFPTNSSYQCLSYLEKILINKKKINIINYGLTLPSFSDKVIDNFMIDFKINKENLIYSHVGRLIPVKRQKLIIKLFYSQVYLKNPNAHLYLIGDGPLEKELKNLVKYFSIENNVTFTGMLNRQDVYKFLQVSDFFIMLSESEGQSVALLEALAYSCIPILNEIKSFRETIDTNYAIYVDEHNPILPKLEKEEINEHKNKVFEYYQYNYSSKKMMKSYSDLYRLMVEKNE